MNKLLIPMLGLLATAVCQAQLDTGNISGTIADKTGATVSGAQVILSNELTGATRTVSSNDQGYYVFSLIPSGTYTIEASHPGFKTYRTTGIALRVNREINVPITIELGEVTERVTVSGTALLVETTSGAIRETIDRVRVTELPINGRNVLQLQGLLPGSVPQGSMDQGANTPGFAINGGTMATNSYSLDGARYQDDFFNAPLPFPNPDAIQEFTVQTNSFSAEFGRNRGVTVNAVTKSGTNEFHGGAFEFVRNNEFDARPFFAKAAPVFKRNQFGSQVGGPIRKNRTFFFFAWQGTHERGTPNTSTSTVPTAKMRAGDFSELSKIIRDPLASAFPGNIIPASRLNPTSTQFLQRFVPLPNSGQFNLVIPLDSPVDQNQYVTRIDHELRQNDRVYGRFMYDLLKLSNPMGNFQGWYTTRRIPRPSIVVNETHTFSPALLNTFSASFNRVEVLSRPFPRFEWRELGANIPPASLGVFGLHSIGVGGYFTAANGTAGRNVRNSFIYEDTLSWTRGHHSLRLGAQISRSQINNRSEIASSGTLSFSGFATNDSLADLLLGRLASLTETSPYGSGLRQSMWHMFASDDIKVSRRLAVNIGVRWEPDTHFREIFGQYGSFRRGVQSTIYPNAPLGQLFRGDPQLPDTITQNQWKNFAPRFGFAYDLAGDGKTAIRGGYGIFYDAIRTISMNRFQLNQPFVLSVSVFDVNLSDPFSGRSPFPYTPPSTPEAKKAFQFITPAAVVAFNHDFRTPYAQQWNLNIQRQLPLDTVATVAYVASKSTRLFGSNNLNPAIYGPGATVATTQQRRIYQQFGTLEDETTYGYSQYHSLQLTVNKRFSRGFTLMGSYTFSKNLGLASAQSEGSTGTRDPFNRNLDKGIMAEDRPQLLAVSAIWNLPSGFSRGVGKQIFGGWELSAIATATSGPPLTARAGVDRSLNAQGLDTADVIGAWRLPGGRSRNDQINQWFNTTAFALPALGTVGTGGLNILRGPGASNLDLGLYRNFKISERYQIQFRGEFFNVLNHTNLGSPTTTFTSAVFGKILNAGTPRVGELGLKFTF